MLHAIQEFAQSWNAQPIFDPYNAQQSGDSATIYRITGREPVRAEMEQEQSKRDHARERKRKQRDTASEESKAKQKESDRLRKK